VRLCTTNGADWSKRYPLIIDGAARIDGSAIFDFEVVWLGSDGVADFEASHGRANDGRATARAFDLPMLNGDDLEPFKRTQGQASRPYSAHNGIHTSSI